jgi:hypothetical protein
VGKGWSTLLGIGILSLNLNWITKFLSNCFVHVNLKNGDRDGLDLLQMIHNTHWWWWQSKIKRIAKLQKGMILVLLQSLILA